MAKRTTGAGWPKGVARPAELNQAHSAFMKQKWQDPEYRARMLPNLANRAVAFTVRNESLRKFPTGTPQPARRHGMTTEQYSALVARPCEVCGDATEPRRHVDHNHSTGEVRGVLCGNCNRALGVLGENVQRILNLADYAARVNHVIDMEELLTLRA